MGFGVFFVDEVDVVGAYNLDTMFLGELHKDFIDLDLHRVCFMVCTGHRGFMPLQFKVIIIAKGLLEPEDGLLGLVKLAAENQFGHFAANTCGGHDKAFVVFGQLGFVGSGMTIITVGVCATDEFYKVMIACFVLCKDNQVASAVILVRMFGHQLVCHIHFTAENGLEFGFSFLFKAFVDLIDIVKKLLDCKHIAVVRDGQAGHTVSNSFVDQSLNRCLAVEQRILSMHMQMNKRFHTLAKIRN